MQRLAQQASPLDNTMRDEIEEEELTTVGSPEARAQVALAEDIQVERRGSNPPRPSLTPLERVANIEQNLDELLISVEDARVQQSLQDFVARIEPKFKDLANWVHQTEQSAVRQDVSMLSIHYNPNALAAVRDKLYKIMADTIESLSTQIYRFRAQHMFIAEINHLSAQVENAMGRVV